MSGYSKDVWGQLKNKTIQEIASALEKDGWIREETSGATQGYRHPDKHPQNNRVVLHIHPKATKSARIMKGLLDTIGWSEEDMIRLSLIKRKGKKKGIKT